MKRKDVDLVLKKFNSFDKNLQFIFDTFNNCVLYFLDIGICLNGLWVFHKNAQTR